MSDVLQPTKGALQQWTVQYEIAGAIDGTELAPSAVLFGVTDEEGVMRVATEDLGIIDPDLRGGRASMGDRFISFIRIETAVPMPIGFAMSVVDASLSVPGLGIIETRRITPPTIAGTVEYISTECTYVPQGQALRVSSMPAPPPGEVHRITLGIKAAVTGDDEARLAEACCCQSEAESGGATPAPPDPEEFSAFQSFDFTTELIALNTATDAYFGFSSAFVTTEPELVITRNYSGSIQPVTAAPGLSRGFIKMAMRAGTVTAMTLRADAAGITYRAFVEVSTGGGAFVRTYLMPAGVALPANTVTPVAIATPVSFIATDRIRVGLDITAGTYNGALDATVEIQTAVE